MKLSALNPVTGKCKQLAALLIIAALFPLRSPAQQGLQVLDYNTVVPGAAQFEKYLPFLKGKRVGIITNNSGLVGNTSIVDTLVKLKVNVRLVFAPEHGFRGEADAGEKVKSGRDPKTGVMVISLYGANKKPNKAQLMLVDVLLYDIQDVGVRFYTYISTMCYAMEACAENRKDFIVLDRPNPNGFYIDGPVMQPEWKGFLGLHPVPVVYGMTCGEYAQMVNGERWLKDTLRCRLKVIPLQNYDRKASYRLPVKPSPNLPNSDAVLLYPSLGLFEGTIMSVGRGTGFPFQVIGHPSYPLKSFSFTPVPNAVSKEPKYVNQVCFGIDLRQSEYLSSHPRQISLSWLGTALSKMKKVDFFDRNFNYHAGNALLQEQLRNTIPEDQVRNSWEPELSGFRGVRQKYLLYPDF